MLLYKNFLLQKINSNQAIFYKEAVYDYVKSLGYKVDDDYEAISILKIIDDNKYTGEGYSPKGEYYFANKYGELTWFTNVMDALMYNGEDAHSTGHGFLKYRRHWHNGLLYLLPDDICEIDELLSTPRGVYCETRDIGFESVDEAATWLANSGLASTPENAKKQLLKHLEGKTSLCYKLKFIQY